jgi:hypothetical protein
LDLHPNPYTGESYVNYEPKFYQAMKAVDPSIKIGIPISFGNYAWATKYSMPILAGAQYDVAVYHNYPVRVPVSDGGTLYQDRMSSNLVRVRGQLKTLQTVLMSDGKSPESIWVTEWDDSVDGFKWSRQSMGAVAPMFVVTQLSEYMRAGVQYAAWWEQGMTGVCTDANYDESGDSTYSWWRCGDTGLVYTGQATRAPEMGVGLRLGDITPAARGFQLLGISGFVTEGEHMLETQTDESAAPWLLSYGATHGTGYAVILINRDRAKSHSVPVAIAEMASGSSVQLWTYGREQYDASRKGDWEIEPVLKTFGPWSGSYIANLPPWSVTVCVFRH